MYIYINIYTKYLVKFALDLNMAANMSIASDSSSLLTPPMLQALIVPLASSSNLVGSCLQLAPFLVLFLASFELLPPKQL